MKLFVIVCILSSWTAFRGSTNDCTPAQCNNEGECSGTTANPNCKCLENYFNGEDCSKLIKYCTTPGICSPKPTCSDHFGGYFCECKDDTNLGTNCSLKVPPNKGVLKSPRLIFTHSVKANDFINILFCIDEAFDFSYILNVAWEFGLIIFMEMKEGEASLFKKSVNMQDTVRGMKIVHSEFEKPEPGFYLQKSFQVTKQGRYILTLGLESLNSDIIHKGGYELLVSIPDNSCYPETELLECKNTNDDAQYIQISQKYVIKTDTTRSCGADSVLTYSWMADDAFDIGGMVKIFSSNDQQLELQPFELPGLEITWNITITVHEAKQDGSQKGVSVQTCFVQYELVPPIVVITGGNTREVGKDDETIIDASDSYDPMLPGKSLASLTFTWECKGTVGNFCKTPMPFTDSKITIPAGKLTVGSYAYTVTASANNRHNSSASTSQNIVVLNIAPPSIQMQCMKNCGPSKSNRRSLTHLKAYCTSKQCIEQKMVYEWDVKPSVPTEDTSTGLNTEHLMINSLALEHGKTYVITVKGWLAAVQNNTGTSTINVVMNEPPKGGTCAIEPKTGSASFTIFKIICTGYQDSDVPIRVKVFQRVEDVESLVVYGKENTILTTQLLEGSPAQINIRIEDSLGVYDWSNTTVEVKPINLKGNPSGTMMYILDSLYKNEHLKENNLNRLITNNDFSKAITKINSLIIAIPILNEVLYDEGVKEYKMTFIDDLIAGLAKIPINDHETVCQISAALQRFAESEILHHKHGLGIAKVMEKLLTVVNEKPFSDVETTEEKVFVTTMLLHVSSRLILPEPIESFLNVTTTTPRPLNTDYGLIEDYPNYVGIDADVMDRLDDMEKRTNIILSGQASLGKYIARSLDEGEPIVEMRVDEIYFCLKVDAPIKIVDNIYRDEKAGGNGSALFINENMIDDITANQVMAGGTVELQVSIINENLFWWHPKTPIMQSDILVLNMRNRMISRGGVTTEDLGNGVFNDAFDIYVKINSSKNNPINGTVNIPTEVDEDDDDSLENLITIHKIYVTKGSSLYIKCTYVSDSIKVIVRLDQRPRYQDFTSQLETIIRNDGVYDDSKVIKAGDGSAQDGSWYYIAVLPNKLTGPSIVNYTFDVLTAECRFWNQLTAQWITDKCKMGNNTNSTMMHCRCYHLSIFSGELFVSPNQIDFQEMTELFLSIKENLVAVITLLVLYVIFILVCIWGWIRDKKDAAMSYATYLENNDPENEYMYLVGVYTGARLNAGTTSHVAIQIQGDKGQSKPHVLYHSQRKVSMKRNTDNWFLLTTPKTLGEIHSVKIWHDNSGRNPAWYCKRIVVQNLETDQSWTFLANRWLSLTHGNGDIYFELNLATDKELRAFRVVFDDLVSHNIENEHLWFGIVTKHPRKPFTRIKRATCALGILLSVMLTSMMFYGISRTNPASQADDGTFNINLRAWIIAIESTLITLPINVLIVLLLTHSKPKKKIGIIEIDSQDKPETALFKSKIAKILVKLSHQYLFPSWCEILGWCLVATEIILCSIFIILYGLTFGKIRSLFWLFSITIGVLQSIFLITPFNIILLALLAALFIHKGPKIPKPMITMPTKEDRICCATYKVYCGSLFLRKRLKLYTPCPRKYLVFRRRREELRMKLRAMLRDLMVFLMYLLVLYWLILDTRDPMIYYSTKNAMDLVLGRKYHQGIEFYDVISDEMYIEYLNETLLPVLFADNWYPGFDIRGYGWLSDYNTKLLGVPRLRQLRVRNDTCKVPEQMNPLISHCIADFTDMATKNYNAKWKYYTVSKWRNDVYRVSDPWLYKTSWDSVTSLILGQIHNYPGGGYISNLGRTLNNSRAILEFLVNTSWIDEKTRAVFVEISIYNVNQNLFNVMTLIAERTAMGTYVTNADITTVRLLMNIRNVPLSVKISFTCFVVISIIFLFKFFRRMYRNGLKVFFKDLWNIIDTMIIFLSVVCVVSYLTRNMYIRYLIEQASGKTKNTSVSFILAAHWEVMLDYFAGFLVCLSTARLWKILRFVTMLKMFEFTLTLAISSLLSISVALFIVLMSFTSMTFLVANAQSYDFHTLYSSTTTLAALSIGFYNKFDYTKLRMNFLGNLIYIAFLCIMDFILINIFVAIICLYFEKARLYDQYYFKETYTMYDYISSEIKDCIGFESMKEKYYAYKTKKNTSLRGGADAPEEDFNLVQTAVRNPYNLQNEEALPCLKSKMEAMKLLATDMLNEDGANFEEYISNERITAMACIATSVLKQDDVINFYRGSRLEEKHLVPDKTLYIMEKLVNHLTKLHHQPSSEIKAPEEMNKEKFRSLETFDIMAGQLVYAKLLLDQLEDMNWIIEELETEVNEIIDDTIEMADACDCLNICENITGRSCPYKKNNKQYKIIPDDESIPNTNFSDLTSVQTASGNCCGPMTMTKACQTIYPELLDVIFDKNRAPIQSTSVGNGIDKATNVHFTETTSMQTDSPKSATRTRNMSAQASETMSSGTQTEGLQSVIHKLKDALHIRHSNDADSLDILNTKNTIDYLESSAIQPTSTISQSILPLDLYHKKMSSSMHSISQCGGKNKVIIYRDAQTQVRPRINANHKQRRNIKGKGLSMNNGFQQIKRKRKVIQSNSRKELSKIRPSPYNQTVQLRSELTANESGLDSINNKLKETDNISINSSQRTENLEQENFVTNLDQRNLESNQEINRTSSLRTNTSKSIVNKTIGKNSSSCLKNTPISVPSNTEYAVEVLHPVQFNDGSRFTMTELSCGCPLDLDNDAGYPITIHDILKENEISINQFRQMLSRNVCKKTSHMPSPMPRPSNLNETAECPIVVERSQPSTRVEEITNTVEEQDMVEYDQLCDDEKIEFDQQKRTRASSEEVKLSSNLVNNGPLNFDLIFNVGSDEFMVKGTGVITRGRKTRVREDHTNCGPNCTGHP